MTATLDILAYLQRHAETPDAIQTDRDFEVILTRKFPRVVKEMQSKGFIDESEDPDFSSWADAETQHLTVRLSDISTNQGEHFTHAVVSFNRKGLK